MSYVTVEVEIDHGRIVVPGQEGLPAKGKGLLTILTPTPLDSAVGPRPFGLARGSFVVPHDFNAPLPEQVLREFEGA
jgi:hypothetical protein